MAIPTKRNEASQETDLRLASEREEGKIGFWTRQKIGVTVVGLVIGVGGIVVATSNSESFNSSRSNAGISSPPVPAIESGVVSSTIPEVVEIRINSLVLSNKESEAQTLYTDIDWETLESIAFTSPEPMEVITQPGEEVNAQDIVDAFLFNRNMAFVLGDPAYQEAFVYNFPENNYNGSIGEWRETRVKFYFDDIDVNYWKQVMWGEALSIKEVDEGYLISGQMIFYLQNDFATNLEVREFVTQISPITTGDGSQKWLETYFEYVGEPLLDREDRVDDTPFTIHRQGEIKLPYVAHED